MREQVAEIEWEQGTLSGVVTLPREGRAPDAQPAVVFLNAGFLQRVGPNRLHVRLARALAAEGLLCLRLDFAGIGDSPARRDALAYGAAQVEETRRAVDYLQRQFGVSRFVPAGVCSGADVAFVTTVGDERACGAILLNPTVAPPDAGARTQRAVGLQIRMRYYRKKLFDHRSWRRLLTLQSNYRGLARTLLGTAVARRGAPAPAAPEAGPAANLRHLRERQVPVLALYSEGSEALDLFRLAFGSDMEPVREAYPNLALDVIDDVDHVFTPLWSQEWLEDRICAWARECLVEVSVGDPAGHR